MCTQLAPIRCPPPAAARRLPPPPPPPPPPDSRCPLVRLVRVHEPWGHLLLVLRLQASAPAHAADMCPTRVVPVGAVRRQGRLMCAQGQRFTMAAVRPADCPLLGAFCRHPLAVSLISSVHRSNQHSGGGQGGGQPAAHTVDHRCGPRGGDILGDRGTPSHCVCSALLSSFVIPYHPLHPAQRCDNDCTPSTNGDWVTRTVSHRILAMARRLGPRRQQPTPAATRQSSGTGYASATICSHSSRPACEYATGRVEFWSFR